MFGFLGGPCGCWSTEGRSVYRSHFCGLCNRLRADYGPAARFLVNRDATFLSLLASARRPQATPVTHTTCCNPLGQPRPVHQEGTGPSYAAAVTICGLQAKLEDEAEDAPSRWRALGARSAVHLMRRRTARAMRELRSAGFPADRVRRALRRQTKVEQAARRDPESSLERASEPSAEALGAIVAHAGGAYSEAWASVGRALGRLIYTLDAVEDREKDARTGAFNALNLEPALVDTVPGRVSADLARIRRTADAAPLPRHRDLVQEILGPLLAGKTVEVLSAQGLAIPAAASVDPGEPETTHRASRRRDRESNGCSKCYPEDCCWCCPGDCGPCCEVCSAGDACCCACPCP